ncbi:uncharacterized protein LOC119675641 [Teleopsis dalmanni]|uniref:uncharacterized protein LOC119675641 n=1 Tax=Teleopsis dalmanni TaxID=139649 RepID=UPI0018CCAA1C|nr:uncharacterized protein LOC119675641 [Teleopsis dalmanni]
MVYYKLIIFGYDNETGSRDKHKHFNKKILPSARIKMIGISEVNVRTTKPTSQATQRIGILYKMFKLLIVCLLALLGYTSAKPHLIAPVSYATPVAAVAAPAIPAYTAPYYAAYTSPYLGSYSYATYPYATATYPYFLRR